MAKHNDTGTLGEQLAEVYFSDNGYTILHRNWRYSRYEVDIIAARQEVLHFIEIKTRRSRCFGRPEEQVSRKKIDNLRCAAEAYLYQHPQWKRIRFDILAITLFREVPAEYFFIEDIF